MFCARVLASFGLGVYRLYSRFPSRLHSCIYACIYSVGFRVFIILYHVCPSTLSLLIYHLSITSYDHQVRIKFIMRFIMTKVCFFWLLAFILPGSLGTIPESVLKVHWLMEQL